MNNFSLTTRLQNTNCIVSFIMVRKFPLELYEITIRNSISTWIKLKFISWMPSKRLANDTGLYFGSGLYFWSASNAIQLLFLLNSNETDLSQSRPNIRYSGLVSYKVYSHELTALSYKEDLRNEFAIKTSIDSYVYSWFCMVFMNAW